VRPVEGLRGAAIVTRAGEVTVEVASGLAESAALDLAEPVARWLPGGPPQWQRVTLHHLLTHTAGVRHWDDAPGFDASQPMDPAERVALIQQTPLLTEPGTEARSDSWCRPPRTAMRRRAPRPAVTWLQPCAGHGG
jgi:Beta-lactamase